jgi:hypothetical protein
MPLSSARGTRTPLRMRDKSETHSFVPLTSSDSQRFGSEQMISYHRM